MKVQQKVFITVIACLLLAVFLPTFINLAKRFTAADSYYSHGFLVPPVSAYLIWRKRKRLKALLPAYPSPSGLILLIAGLLLHFISTVLKINFTSYLSLIIVLIGSSLYLLGKKVTREIAFPLGFLLFMIPLPAVIIIGLSFKMKILAAQIASKFVNMLGIPTLRDGSTIYLPHSFLLVGDPCSGLRSLISFLALGALFTQLISASRFKKNVLFLSTVPIALISNILRIIALLLVTYVYGQRIALGLFHDLTGIAVFIFAFIGLSVMVKILKCQKISLI